MTSRFRHNVTFAAALVCLSIAVFLAAFWYLAMSTNVFHAQSNTSTYRINVNNVKTHVTTTPAGPLTPSRSTTTTTSSPVKSPNDCTGLDTTELLSADFFHPDTLHKIGVTEYVCVRPVKLHKKSLHTDDLLYESKNNGSGHNHSATLHFTGEYRNRDSRLWDPHPQYTLEAFGMNMRLDLYNDGSFIHTDLKVTHAWPNETLRRKSDHDDHDQLRACYYRGSVYSDSHSTVSVSLCNGMTGHIRTHQGTFMIRPAEKYADDKRNILHIMYRLQSVLPGKDYIDDIVHNGNEYNEPSPRRFPDSNAIDRHEAPRFSEDQHHSGFALTHPQRFDAHFMEIGPGGETGKIRKKRSTHNNHNNEYTMEILVAVDKKMQEYHGDETRNYVLTLMSIVSNIFADASIGNSISIAVVHIMFLQENVAHDANGIGVEASKMLMDFCRIKNEKFKHDHDTALLLTREQICRNPSETKCDTLGLAELGTICRKESCSLVQDNGLSAAFTIAHELGHILNMPHDDDMKCNQIYGNQKKEHFIMSRMLGKNTHPWAWSNCSRHFATEYLENNHGSCMLNTPKHGVIEPNTGNSQLAGEKFNQHQQCELVYGPGSKICSYMPECSSLWCVTSGDKPDEGCRSQAMPWADGTPCGGHGSNKWCQKAKCVARNRDALRPVDGGWGQWSPWSQCSLTCGGGIQSSHRHCDSPAPANYGKYCTGHRVRYNSCNTENCPSNLPDIRSQQCREFDNNNFEIASLNEDVKWVPKYGVSTNDECKLYCRVNKNTLYFLLKHKVKDGTPCNQDGFDKCVNGHCHQAGCDNILYSTAVLDKCGVCNGRNDTCEDVNGSLTRNHLRRMVEAKSAGIYHRVAVIPEGALNIEIRQPGYPDDKTFIALRGENGENLLNAESSITNFPREFAYAGVIFKYNGANQSMEMVTTTYATVLHKRLSVELLIVRTSKSDMEWLHGDPEIISYSYTIPKAHPTARKSSSTPMVLTASHPYNPYSAVKRQHRNYQWKMSEYASCDKLCYGKRYRTAACVNMDEAQQVDHNHCPAHSRPNDESEDCNTNCHVSWGIKKSNCSVVCGEGYRTAEHVCTQKFNNDDRAVHVDDSHCPEIRNKVRTEPCSESCSNAYWDYGPWEPCPQRCGGAVHNRTAYCYSHPGGSPVESVFCQGLLKDEIIRVCNTDPCPEWVYDENTPVPAPQVVMTMMDESKTRQKDLYNVVPQHPNSLFPSNHPKHSSTAAPAIINLKYEWKTGRWGNCSTCGSAGKRQRTVRCSKTTGVQDYQYVDDYYCDIKMRPVNITSCADVSCNIWNFNQWSECDDNCETTRQVICQNEQERLSDNQCDSTKRPPERKTCCHIKWRSIRTPCSGTCGYGERVRKKVCMKLMPKSSKNPHPIKTGKVVEDHRCRGLPEPKYPILRRPCRKSCVFNWKVSNWSKCDVGCGSGVARRDVVCTNGTTNSLVDCDVKKKPKKSIVCQSKEHCVWRIKKWKSSHSQCKCDGYQKVRTVCMDDLRKRRSTYCNEADRPAHKQACAPNPPYCSCYDVKRYHHKRDGEYGLNVGGRNVSIYCHDLHTDSPKEYVTLVAGNTENYALYMGNRSKQENTCPYDPNDTFMDPKVPAGTTRFNKIRVKVNGDDLQVVDDDYEFAVTSGRQQQFGTAGDCFSNNGNCPQGVFRINLEGTGLKLNSATEWAAEGSNSAVKFHTPLRPPYLNVIGRCGGYCGKCRPSSPLRLSVLSND